MVKKTHDSSAIDILARPIPGQSLTDAPKSRPYEKPPQITSPTDAFKVVTESLEEPSAHKDIVELLDVGISAETLASSVTLKMFSEGVFTPDIAEIIKLPLTAFITEVGIEAGVEDINVVNDLPDKERTPSDNIEMMANLNPDKLTRQATQLNEEEEIDEALLGLEIPEDEEPSRESFLDMEVQ